MCWWLSLESLFISVIQFKYISEVYDRQLFCLIRHGDAMVIKAVIGSFGSVDKC